MRACLVVLLLAACGADNTSGARGQCAAGGAINNECPAVDPTAEGACTYLVECAVIPEASSDDNVFDWAKCVNAIEGRTSDREQLVIECIEASTCDALQVDGSPDQPNAMEITCLRIGDNP